MVFVSTCVSGAENFTWLIAWSKRQSKKAPNETHKLTLHSNDSNVKMDYPAKPAAVEKGWALILTFALLWGALFPIAFDGFSSCRASSHIRLGIFCGCLDTAFRVGRIRNHIDHISPAPINKLKLTRRNIYGRLFSSVALFIFVLYIFCVWG